MSRVTADELCNKKFANIIISDHVRDILTDIDVQLKIAHDDGKNTTIFSASADFCVEGMDNRDAQLIIYYSVIRDLEKRKFTVRLKLYESKTDFAISWYSEYDATERAMMSAELAARST